MIPTLEGQALRKKMLDTCIAKQQYLTDDFQDRIDEFTKNEDSSLSALLDDDDLGSLSNAEEIDALHEQLAFARRELVLLQNIRTNQHMPRHTASLSAIVVTDHYTFFVSASLEKLSLEGHTSVGISTASPIYKAMEGKTKGDTFDAGGIHYKIKDVF